jgi:hypothetical protein
MMIAAVDARVILDHVAEGETERRVNSGEAATCGPHPLYCAVAR